MEAATGWLSLLATSRNEWETADNHGFLSKLGLEPDATPRQVEEDARTTGKALGFAMRERNSRRGLQALALVEGGVCDPRMRTHVLFALRDLVDRLPVSTRPEVDEKMLYDTFSSFGATP